MSNTDRIERAIRSLENVALYIQDKYAKTANEWEYARELLVDAKLAKEQLQAKREKGIISNIEKITYEVQKLVGVLIKQWKPISYDFDTLAPAIELKRLTQADNPKIDFRIIKKTLLTEPVED